MQQTLWLQPVQLWLYGIDKEAIYRGLLRIYRACQDVFRG